MSKKKKSLFDPDSDLAVPGEAVEFLSHTEMQSFPVKDLGGDIVNATSRSARHTTKCPCGS